MSGTISLLDPEGVRHEIDLETWVSYCYVWVVKETDGGCHGKAVRNREAASWMPVNVMGSQKTEYVPGVSTVVDAECRFGPSELPITCLLCLGELRGP